MYVYYPQWRILLKKKRAETNKKAAKLNNFSKLIPLPYKFEPLSTEMLFVTLVSQVIPELYHVTFAWCLFEVKMLKGRTVHRFCFAVYEDWSYNSRK